MRNAIRKGKKGSKRRSRGRNAHVKQEDDVSASDDSGNVTEMDSDNDDEEDENDVRNVVYVSAGTKTRPGNNSHVPLKIGM